MAKLIELVCVAGWLVVGLAVILCTTSAPTTTGLQQRAAGLFLNAEKTRGQWADWRDNIVGGFTAHCKRHPSLANWKPCSYLTSAINWLNQLELMPDKTGRNEKFQTDCTADLETGLLRWQEAMNKPLAFKRFVNAYLKLYLHSCGSEEGFQKAIENGENLAPDWNSIKSLTLYRYVKNSLRPKELDKLLLYSRAIFEIDSTSKQISCSWELEDAFLHWLDKSKSDENWHERVKDRFFVYLDKCGPEEQFKKVIDNTEIDASLRWKADLPQTLSGYFGQRQILEVSDVTLILSVIRRLLALEKRPEEHYCTEDSLAGLINFISSTEQLPEFQSLVNGYFAIYLNRCGLEQSFKSRIGNMQQDQDDNKTLFSFVSTSTGDASKRLWFLSAIKKLSNLGSISKKTDCTWKFKSNIIEWLIESRKNQYSNEALKGYFSLYLDQCGYEEQFEKVINKLEQMSGDRRNSAEYKTLFSYLVSKDWQQSELEWILSAIGELSELASVSGEADCTQKLINRLLGVLSRIKEQYPELHVVLGEFGKFYNNLCASQLEALLQ